MKTMVKVKEKEAEIASLKAEKTAIVKRHRPVSEEVDALMAAEAKGSEGRKAVQAAVDRALAEMPKTKDHGGWNEEYEAALSKREKALEEYKKKRDPEVEASRQGGAGRS